MNSTLGAQILLAAFGTLPAIFLHLQRRGFLRACILSSLTSCWAVFLSLLFLSGIPWPAAAGGAISWMPGFFLVAMAVGVPVNIILKAAELSRTQEAGLTPGQDAGNLDNEGAAGTPAGGEPGSA